MRVRGESALVGKTDAQNQLVDALVQLRRQHAARREIGQCLAEIRTHVFVGAPPLEVAVVTGKVRQFSRAVAPTAP